VIALSLGAQILKLTIPGLLNITIKTWVPCHNSRQLVKESSLLISSPWSAMVPSKYDGNINNGTKKQIINRSNKAKFKDCTDVMDLAFFGTLNPFCKLDIIGFLNLTPPLTLRLRQKAMCLKSTNVMHIHYAKYHLSFLNVVENDFADI
jgi:hypothetical protein